MSLDSNVHAVDWEVFVDRLEVLAKGPVSVILVGNFAKVILVAVEKEA